MILSDFHVHSNFSDGRLSVGELVDLYGVRGFGCIAITDHICETQTFLGKAAHYLNRTLTAENFPDYMKTLAEEGARAWDQYRMILIPGFELTKNFISNRRSAHLLGIGIREFMPADGDIADLCKDIRNQGALVVAAHPVSTRKMEKQTYHLWSRREELAPLVDAWEVASGPHLFPEVLDSSLPKIATSDLHAAWQISAWKTVLDCEKHPEAILRAVRRQNLSFRFYDDREFLRSFQKSRAPRQLGRYSPA